MASELHPWRFELDTFPSRLPCGHPYRHVFGAQTDCSAVPDLWSIFFFSKCFEQNTSWCFGSHFFVATVLSIHCHLPLSFTGFIFKGKSMERKLLRQLFTATNYRTLARRALKFAILLSIQFCSSRYWAMRVSCLVLTSRRSRDQTRDFQLQTTQLPEASCLFSLKSIL